MATKSTRKKEGRSRKIMITLKKREGREWSFFSSAKEAYETLVEFLRTVKTRYDNIQEIYGGVERANQSLDGGQDNLWHCHVALSFKNAIWYDKFRHEFENVSAYVEAARDWKSSIDYVMKCRFNSSDAFSSYFDFVRQEEDRNTMELLNSDNFLDFLANADVLNVEENVDTTDGLEDGVAVGTCGEVNVLADNVDLGTIIQDACAGEDATVVDGSTNIGWTRLSRPPLDDESGAMCDDMPLAKRYKKETKGEIVVCYIREHECNLAATIKRFPSVPNIEKIYHNVKMSMVEKRDYDIKMLVLHGKTGVGKTLGSLKVLKWSGVNFVKQSSCDNGGFFNVLDYEDVLVLDEFTSEHWKLPKLNELCDSMPPPINIKYGQASNVFKGIILTTNLTWDDWYKGERKEMRDALFRRIHWETVDNQFQVMTCVMKYLCTFSPEVCRKLNMNDLNEDQCIFNYMPGVLPETLPFCNYLLSCRRLRHVLFFHTPEEMIEEIDADPDANYDGMNL